MGGESERPCYMWQSGRHMGWWEGDGGRGGGVAVLDELKRLRPYLYTIQWLLLFCCMLHKWTEWYLLPTWAENNFTFTLMTTRTFSWTISKLFSELKLVTDNLFFIDQRLEHSKGSVKASCLVNSRLMNTKFVSYNWLGIPLLLPCLCSLLWPNLLGIPSPFFAFCKWSKIGSLVPRSCPKSQEFDPDHTCKISHLCWVSTITCLMWSCGNQ